MQNSDFWTRITNLYGAKRSPVVLCMQYSVISNRITCLYRYQPLSVVFAGKTATFGPAYKTQWVPDLTCRFVHANSVPSIRITSLYGSPSLSVLLCMQNSDFRTSIQVSMGTRHPLSFCASKTSGLAPEILVPIGPSPHL